jgi:hypothetical protein
MKNKFKFAVLVTLLAVNGSISAQTNGLTKDEKFLTDAVDLRVLNTVYAKTRKTSVAGQNVVCPKLVLCVTDSEGQIIDSKNLPPVLENLEADLRNTDIIGELKNGGMKIGREGSISPELTIFVMSLPTVDKSELKTRKMYSVTAFISQYIQTGLGIFAKSAAVVVGTYKQVPIISVDDATDAAKIRVAVRKIVDKYLEETKGK